MESYTTQPFEFCFFSIPDCIVDSSMWCMSLVCSFFLLNALPLGSCTIMCSLKGLMLKLKLHYLGHLMWRTDSLEKTLILGKTWRQEEKGMTEDEMVGWHHWLGRYEFEQALGVGNGQTWSASVHRVAELDMTEWLNCCWLFLSFFNLFGCAGFVLLGGLFSSCGAQASHCGVFSCCVAQALGHLSFSICGTQA